MFSRLKGARPSPALVISLVALFVSLGGVGYAAVTITGKNVKNGSLTGKDIKNSSLTGSDVKNSSLSTSDVKNGSLLSSDFKAGQLPAGPQGPQRAAGRDGFANLDYNVSATFPNPAGSQSFGDVACDSGDHATGGGVFGDDGIDQSVNSSFPSIGDTADNFGSTGWGAYVNNNSATDSGFEVYVICAHANSISAAARSAAGKK